MSRSSLARTLGSLILLCACSSKTASSDGNAAGNSSSPDAGDAAVSGGAGGAGTGGSSAGNAGTAGVTSGNPDAGGDLTDAGATPRPISVSDERPDEMFAFYPEDANPSAVRWYDAQQVARFKRKLNGTLLPVRAKLVIVLNGVGGSAGPNEVGEWLADRGFHSLTLDYDNLATVRLFADSVPNDGLPGAIEAYSEIIEGVDYSQNIQVPKADSVFGRIESGLQYLSTVDPGADWGYYLNADGSVRLSDVIFFGYSFGGATSTVVGKRFNVARVVAAAAPRYELDTTGDWLQGPSVTPLDRFYTIVGNQDPDFAAIEATIDALGVPGDLVDTSTVAAPYHDSHRLQTNLGHVAMCSGTDLDDVCDYAFGISP